VAEGKVNVNGQELAAGDAAIFDGKAAAEVKGLDRSQVLLFDLN
jgi:redox-sensitive bicupin YhaK (pirin superfamily)